MECWLILFWALIITQKVGNVATSFWIHILLAMKIWVKFWQTDGVAGRMPIFGTKMISIICCCRLRRLLFNCCCWQRFLRIKPNLLTLLTALFSWNLRGAKMRVERNRFSSRDSRSARVPLLTTTIHCFSANTTWRAFCMSGGVCKSRSRLCVGSLTTALRFYFLPPLIV